MQRRTSTTIVYVLLVGTLVAACSGGGRPLSIAETHFTGTPEGFSNVELGVAPHEDSRKLQIITSGSSNCPSLPTAVNWRDRDSVLEVSVAEIRPESGICSTDITRTTSVLELPDNAPDAPRMTVVIDGQEFIVGDRQ